MYSKDVSSVWVPLTTWVLNANMVDQMGDFSLYGFATRQNGAAAFSFLLRAILIWGTTYSVIGGVAVAVSDTLVNERKLVTFGRFALPPVGVPRDAEIDTVSIRIDAYYVSGGNQYMGIDNLQLVPVDEGYALMTDHNVMDSIKEPPSFYKLDEAIGDTSDYMQNVTTSSLGEPFDVLPGQTNRIYVRNGLTIGTAAFVRAKIRPRYLL